MKKLYSYFFFVFFVLSTISNAQNKLVQFRAYNSGTSSFPISQSASNLNTSLVSSASIDYSRTGGISTFNDGRSWWQITNSSPTLDASTAPYLEYTLNFNSSVNLDFDRFVISGGASNSATKFELRWSVDNYTSSLGLFTIGSDWAYRRTSVNLNSLANFVGSQLKFRLYFYNTSPSGSHFLHSETGPYSSLDSTPQVPYDIWSVITSIWYNPPPPTISSFTPSSGAIGSSVVITGTDFTGATAVKFNGTNATSFTVNSATQITATVPSGSTTGTIEITTSAGSGTSTSSYTVIPPPTISSFTPSSAGVGSSVVITGTDFTAATAVKFNGTNATSFTVNSATQITATVPSGATTGTISVTTAGGTRTSTSNFTVIPPPTISSFTPSSGVVGSTVTITGTNFTNATAVRFNGTDATNFTVNSATQITATVPSGVTTGTISVTTPGGTVISSSSFTFIPPPTISSFTPSSGAIGSPVVISGTNFTGATAVSFNGTNATSLTVNSATQITARVPAGATTGAILVTTPGGTVTSATNITIGGEVLLEYPFNNSLAPSIGTGVATITLPAAATLGSSSVCTDNLNNTGSFRTAAIPLSSFNVNAFQFDVDFSLPSLPPTATSFLLNSSDLGRDFGLLVSPQGRLIVYYRASSVQEINSQSTNVQLVANTNYNLSVQFIANTIRMRLNGNLVLVVDVADGIVIPTNPRFIFGDAYGAALSMSACIDNFRFIKDPLPFSFADQLVISPTAFSSFEACVNRPSVAQTFSVSGTNLSNNSVVIRAPNGIYEISQNGTSFSTSPITLTASAGTLNPTTIHVRVISNPTAGVLSPTKDRILNIEVGSSNPLYRKSYILQGNILAQSPTISGSNSVMAGDSSTLTATTTPANSNAWVSSNTTIASISNTGVVTGLTPGSTTITYTNASGCTATQVITVVAGTTQPPVLTSPVSNTTGATTLNINYSLPENSLAGSVRLTFTPTAGGTPIVWTMTNASSVSFSYAVGTNPAVANPNNVVSGAALPFGNYNLTLSYQDAFGNPVAQVTNTNIQTLAPPSISFASSTQNAVVNRAISIVTNNSGGAASFTITPTLPTGLTINSSTGLISGIPTASMASRSYTVTATNAAGTNTAIFNLFIDADMDGDGVGDTTDPDIDGDGVPNTVETQEGSNPTNPNDYKDTDGDGVPDYIEVQQGTNPNNPNDRRDTDGDGVPDYVEILQGTNPNTPGDQLIDSDGDGVPNYVELQQGTNPNNPNDRKDSDGDGVPDYVEIRQGTNPNLPNNPVVDTDGDGIIDSIDTDDDGDTILDINDAFPLDKTEWKDTDGDGIGDNADTDDDNDGILDVCDVDINGDRIPDNGTDIDGDGIIDSCDPDRDGDGVNNASDNCPDLPNTDQADRDRDGLGNVCDTIVLNAAQTFTPNGDGINDTWVVYNLENHPGSIVRVFNSNGKQVFYSANYKNDWNGNYQGSSEMLPIGSYLYQIDLDGDGSIDEQAWLYITK